MVPVPLRRHVLLGMAALLASPSAVLGVETLFVISRERILREVRAARVLRQVETEMTATLQAQIDRAKAQLAAEEAELARLRAEMDPKDFDQRAADFDRRVRLTRRIAQERATQLQKGFQEARAAIVAAVPDVIDRVRIEAGARIILNGDHVIVVDPALDLTDRVIQLVDEKMPDPPVPDINLEEPIFIPADPSETEGGAGE